MKIGILSAGSTIQGLNARETDTTTTSPAKVGDGVIVVACPPGHRSGATVSVGATPTPLRRSFRGRQG
jgi:hypothetical protein